MSSIQRAPNARSKTSYIATMAYPSNIYQYTQSQDANFNTQGYLSSLQDLTTGNATNCSKGRVLVETGERLFPGQPGISTFMVKVTDINSKLSGYIDPNCQAFAQYNDNRPVETADGVDTSGNVTHRGGGIYTSGNVLANGNLKVGGTTDLSGALTVAAGGATVTAGGLTVTAGGIVATTGTIRSATVTGITYGTNTILINPTLGTVYQVTVPNGQNANIQINTTIAPPAGTLIFLAVTVGTLSGGPYNFVGTQFGGNVTVSMGSSNITASRTNTLTFISNGANLLLSAAALA